jgi:hypothetical protein
MRRTKECSCNHGIFDFSLVEFMVNKSRIELRCRKCNGIIGWWDEQGTKKIMPIKRVWSEEECLTMR